MNRLNPRPRDTSYSSGTDRLLIRLEDGTKWNLDTFQFSVFENCKMLFYLPQSKFRWQVKQTEVK